MLKGLIPALFLSLSLATSQNLIVLNKSENTAMFFNLKNDRLISQLQTGEAPHEVAISPNKKYAIVTNYGTREKPGNSLSIYNLEKLTLEKVINLGELRRPHGVEWLDNEKVVVTVEANKSIAIVDVKNEKIVKEIKTEQEVSHMLVISPDKSKCFVANIGSGSVSVIDLNKGELIKTILTGKGSEGIDITPDGKEVWVTNRAEDSVAVIDVKTLDVKKKFKVDGFPIRVKFSKDGKFAVISCARSGEIAIVDAISKNVLRRVKTAEKSDVEKAGRLFGSVFGDSPVPIGIAIDKQNFIYVANSNADIISVIKLGTGEMVRTIKTGKEPDGIAVW
ncbi:YncE family protein [Candidatus Kryptonium thompsonii]|uniref:YncE family protein n=1 Tax=Candidatus Kryptonium thompsonii TaxID=1633631 RepID=UPI0007078906|nr:YncE family protein [Candidatus Kryptonium thompsoni]CUS88048.1 40-residue YVTN family beta-propeller repeat-containing protein [Candidatus Kryptonium thompsoni]